MAPDADMLKSRFFAARLSLAVGVAMLLMKWTGYLMTGSASIYSDALESVVHVAATAFAWYSVQVSARPADSSHPYGHGKVEFFSAGFEDGLILLAALAIVAKAVTDIIAQPPLQQLGFGVGIVIVAGVINLALGWYLIRVGHRTHSLTIVADGKHVLTDSYTSLGVAVGLGLVMLTGNRLIDPIVALLIAGNIAVTAFRLMRESVRGLMDEQDLPFLTTVLNAFLARRKPGWIDVHRLRSWQSGEWRHVDCHVIFPWYWDIARAHEEEETMQAIMTAQLGDTVDVLVHRDPCGPGDCPFCDVLPCAERKAARIGARAFTIDRAVLPYQPPIPE